MSLQVWSTTEPPTPAFATAWRERTARIPDAHYAMGQDYLAWEAAHGRPASALLVDEDSLAGALVMRREGAWVSGWPWRWQALVESSDGSGTIGLSVEAAERMFAVAQRQVGAARLVFHQPGPRPPGAPCYAAGSTHVHRLDLGGEAALWKNLGEAKRRNVKRARRDGYEIVEATTPDQFLAFQRLQLATEERRGNAASPVSETLPAPGEGYREWELPWMWLLLAVRQGRIEAGSGFGRYSGATIDYRTNASSLDGKRDGANVLLAWEALRRGGEAGYRRLNWGGATRFKRELGGEPVEVWCRLGGGAAWAVPNQLTASLRRTRPRLAAWWRSMRPAAGAQP